MSDRTNVVAFRPQPPEGGGPAGNASATEPGNASQPQTVTLDQVTRMTTAAEENAVRRAQSLVDKADSRITKEIRQSLSSLNETIKMQRDAGMQITPQQEAELRNRVLERAFTTQGAADTAQTSAQQAAQPAKVENETDPNTAKALRMMQKAGVYIEDGDPEVAMIDQSDEDTFFLSLGPAIQAKKQRLTQKREAAQQRQAPGTAPGTPPMTPTNAGGSGSGLSLEAQYKSDLAKVAGNAGAVIELKRNYRRRGLDIW